METAEAEFAKNKSAQAAGQISSRSYAESDASQSSLYIRFCVRPKSFGKSLKMLTLIDEYTRECLAVEVGVSIKGERVRQILQRVCADMGKPEQIRSDNGSEFISTAVGGWLTENDIKPLFIEPGKPWQNGRCESSNGKLRDECLSREWFSSVKEAQVVIEGWRCFYNQERPHSSLEYMTPWEFKSKMENNQSLAIQLG